jgi:hypothetical protein
MRRCEMRPFLLLVLVMLGACAKQSPGDSGPRRAAPTPGLGDKNTVPVEALAPGSCDDAPLVTLEEVATGKTTEGRIALDAVPDVRGMCTLLYCGPGDGCCNECGGDYGAKLVREPADRDLELRLDGLAGCSGMDCNFHCEPFGRAPTDRYRFVGTLTFQPAGVTSVFHKATVKVEKFCRNEKQAAARVPQPASDL